MGCDMAEIENVELFKKLFLVDCESCKAHYDEAIRELQSNNIGFQHTINELFESLKKADKQIPKWHLVAENDLPEEHICNDGYVEPSDFVYVFTAHGQYMTSRYWGNRKSKNDNNLYADWVEIDCETKEVIAWMELPKFEEVE